MNVDFANHTTRAIESAKSNKHNPGHLEFMWYPVAILALLQGIANGVGPTPFLKIAPQYAILPNPDKMHGPLPAVLHLHAGRDLRARNREINYGDISTTDEEVNDDPLRAADRDLRSLEFKDSHDRRPRFTPDFCVIYTTKVLENPNLSIRKYPVLVMENKREALVDSALFDLYNKAETQVIAQVARVYQRFNVQYVYAVWTVGDKWWLQKHICEPNTGGSDSSFTMPNKNLPKRKSGTFGTDASIRAFQEIFSDLKTLYGFKGRDVGKRFNWSDYQDDGRPPGSGDAINLGIESGLSCVWNKNNLEYAWYELWQTCLDEAFLKPYIHISPQYWITYGPETTHRGQHKPGSHFVPDFLVYYMSETSRIYPLIVVEIKKWSEKKTTRDELWNDAKSQVLEQAQETIRRFSVKNLHVIWGVGYMWCTETYSIGKHASKDNTEFELGTPASNIKLKDIWNVVANRYRGLADGCDFPDCGLEL